MNKVTLIGRFTKDPDVGMTKGENSKAFAFFTLAVDRRFKDANGKKQADFISCKAYGPTADFIGKWFAQGDKIAVNGWIMTGSYQAADGRQVFTTDVMVDDAEFCESKGAKK